MTFEEASKLIKARNRYAPAWDLYGREWLTMQDLSRNKRCAKLGLSNTCDTRWRRVLGMEIGSAATAPRGESPVPVWDYDEATKLVTRGQVNQVWNEFGEEWLELVKDGTQAAWRMEYFGISNTTDRSWRKILGLPVMRHGGQHHHCSPIFKRGEPLHVTIANIVSNKASKDTLIIVNAATTAECYEVSTSTVTVAIRLLQKHGYKVMLNTRPVWSFLSDTVERLRTKDRYTNHQIAEHFGFSLQSITKHFGAGLP